ncbi:MAG: aminotransferase class I/II-fold pyridoxal phosphate-dependent enzyme [Francisellaceae bacterium]|jgi:alanine-synthesizing transaminase|nr:aminotransferase class I/II-fold pyridoxal phosphate-dependent enzyme [Francisellaceae bacterium]MBT6208320.1 aminotransferase class I/II-fold pyridoxal phosphate-dependent enzyme [Francisellaceae bacterium]MBT6539851.1 aminotransferase class I/II-fold pyridoxal phosphate-dependent enzyme [Francisellaceae bacterium]
MQYNSDRINRIPPYMFGLVNQLKMDERHKGHDIVDFGMGNPDQPPNEMIVEKLVEVARRQDTHRYSNSKGIPRLRKGICNWYQNRFGVPLDYETEAIATFGSKEGLAHLALALVDKGDTVIAPNPAYPIHTYGFIIAGAQIVHIPIASEKKYIENLKTLVESTWPRPKVLIINFPANPTTQCVSIDFFAEIVGIAKKYDLKVVHDIAYAEIYFDEYKPPSILQVKGAKDIAVETYSMSKTYNMPGWRVGFVCGNKHMVGALAKLKSYLDYGMFTPIQVAAISALESDDSLIADIRNMYKVRRDVLCQGLAGIGWDIDVPQATMFAWAKIPKIYSEHGSLEFCKRLIKEAKVAVAPGIGFGDLGDQHVRFSFIENEHRTRQAIKEIKAMFIKDGAFMHGGGQVEAG